MWNEIIKFKTVLLAITAIIGVAFGFDALYARSDKVELLAMRLDQKIVEDYRANLQARKWQLEDRYGCSQAQCRNVMPEVVFNEYRWLCQEYDNVPVNNYEIRKRR